MEETASKSYDPIVNQQSDSLCSSCQREVANGGADELPNNHDESNNEATCFDDAFARAQEDEAIIAALNELEQTAKSFSQVSLDGEMPTEEAAVNSVSQNFLEVSFYEVLVEEDEDNAAEPPCKKSKPNFRCFVDKEVQTEEDPWACEFPVEKELQEIELSIRRQPEPASNIEIIKEISPIVKKATFIPKPDCNAISSIILNRRKKLTDLTKDIVALSTYLEDIKKAITTKEPSAQVVIPPPPVMTVFDSQFDFPNQNRFGKLPIRVESSITNKPIDHIKQSNPRVRPLIATKKTVKRLNNAINITANVKTKQRQTTIDESFKSTKENTMDNYKRTDVSYNKTIVAKEVNEKTKIKLCDSDSMYNYNPLKNQYKKKYTKNIPKTK